MPAVRLECRTPLEGERLDLFQNRRALRIECYVVGIIVFEILFTIFSDSAALTNASISPMDFGPLAG